MRSKSESKMSGRRGWATVEQQAFLKEQIPGFLIARVGGQRTLNPFWDKLYDDWFIRWPEPSTSPSQTAGASSGGVDSSKDELAQDILAEAKEARKLVRIHCHSVQELNI
jgi:hypothetical protein